MSDDRTFLKAKDSPGLQTGIVDLWTCTQATGGPLRAVLFAIFLPTGVEGVVVLKEGCGFDEQLSASIGFKSVTSGQENKMC